MPLNYSLVSKKHSANRANVRCKPLFADKKYSVATDYGCK